MRHGRRIPLVLALGALTSLAVAWGLSLWPTRANQVQGRVQLEVFGERAERGLYVTDERRTGGRTFILITDEERFDGFGPSWEPWGLPQPGVPRWALQAQDAADVDEALKNFPFPRGIPRPSTYGAPDVELPYWLPRIPQRAGGLLAYGGRGAGWPLVCVRSILEVDPHTRTTRWSCSWRVRPSQLFQVGPYNSQDPESGSVSWQPAPIGFAADTLIYGGGWWLVLFAPRAVRRWRRVRAGRCGACGYSLGGLASGAACPECGGPREEKSR